MKTYPQPPLEALKALFPKLTLRNLPGFLVPQPYRNLLVHDQDMTSTLERFHREALYLEPLSSEREPRILRRNVLLVGSVSGRPRELGAITIYLHRFPSCSADKILAGTKPLGAILSEDRIAYTSRPEDFLELQSTLEVLAALRLPESAKTLYGRRNSLHDPAGELLADVLEILPSFEED